MDKVRIHRVNLMKDVVILSLLGLNIITLSVPKLVCDVAGVKTRY